MSNVNFRTVRVALNTSTGTQDITIPGFGTPKAAIFIYDIPTSNDTITITSRNSKGYTDGTNQCVAGVVSIGNQGTSNTARMTRNDRVISQVTSVGESASASFDSWITDGVRINISDAPSVASFVTVTLINGTDVTDAHAEFSASLTSTSNNITTLGFEPDIVFIDSIGSSASSAVVGAHAIISSGIAINDGTDKNFSVMNFDEDNQATSDTGQLTSSTYCTGQFFNGTMQWGGAIENYDADGFNINTNASPGNDRVIFLALKFSNSPMISASIEDSPTATGSHSFGSAPSIPSYLYMITANNTILETAENGLGISNFVGDSTNQYTQGWSSRDANTTTLVNSISKSGGLTQLFNGSKQFDSTFTSFTATGADFNFTTTDSTARKWISLFIGEGAASGITVTAESGSYIYTGTNADLLTTRIIQADSGSYAYTGTSVNLLKGFVLVADTGSYSYVGTDATLTFTPVGSFILTANTGGYTYSGTDINFNRNRVIIAASGIYTYSGSDIQIILPGQVWTDKPAVSTVWGNKALVSTSWGDKTPVNTTWTDK